MTRWLDNFDTLCLAAQVCRVFAETCQSPELWEPHLVQFFGDELPPEVITELETGRHPKVILREQCVAVEALIRREDSEACILKPPNVVFPVDTKMWMKDLDRRVAECQLAFNKEKPGSFPHAHKGIPDYGCSGGAYSTFTTWLGPYTKTEVSGPGSAYGIPEEDSRLIAWNKCELSLAVKWEDCDAESLAQWVDQKCLDLALDQEDAAFLVPKLRKRVERWNSHTRKFKYAPDLNLTEAKEKKRSHIMPLRLCLGRYSGLFAGGVLNTSIGDIYSIDCLVDGSSIADYSGM